MQLCTLKSENKCLIQKLKTTEKGAPLDACNNGLNNSNEDQASNIDSSNASCTKSSDEEIKDPSNKNFQVFFHRFYTSILFDKLCGPILDSLEICLWYHCTSYHDYIRNFLN